MATTVSAQSARVALERARRQLDELNLTYQHFGAWWLCPACNYTATQAASAAPKEPHR